MTEPDIPQIIRRLLRESIGELAPHCQFILCFLIALLAERTISLPWIIQAFPGSASPESKRKRIQRFLEDVRICPEAFAPVIASFLPRSPWILVMDRTNWFWGKCAINLLVLAVHCQGVAVPLLWMHLQRDGASDTEHRKELIRQFIRLFGRHRISYITGDREFIGEEWIKWLHDCHLPFRLRLRVSDRVRDHRGRVYEVSYLFSRSMQCRKGKWLLWGTWVYLGGKPLNKDWLIVASSHRDNLLEDYKRRWSIECLFQALKGRGFDLESTRVILPDRLCRLLGLLALAYLICVRIGLGTLEEVCKTTERLRKSVSRRGLELAHRVSLWLVDPPTQQEIQAFMRAFAPCKT